MRGAYRPRGRPTVRCGCTRSAEPSLRHPTRKVETPSPLFPQCDRSSEGTISIVGTVSPLFQDTADRASDIDKAGDDSYCRRVSSQAEWRVTAPRARHIELGPHRGARIRRCALRSASFEA